LGAAAPIDASSAFAMSSRSGKRFSGSLSSARIVTAASPFGSRSALASSGGGGAVRIFVIRLVMVGASNGRLPDTIS
jgi:hypothetical protein